MGPPRQKRIKAPGDMMKQAFIIDPGAFCMKKPNNQNINH